MKPAAAVLFPILIGFLAASPLRAADFPPVTDEEWALTSVPGEPNAPVLVLFKKGEFLMTEDGQAAGSLASRLRIQARVKILTEMGKSSGEIVIAHSESTRLENFAGRTVLPGGRIVSVPADARFVRKTSQARRTFTTAVAFPAVEVGAILDYRYELVFESPYFLDPWYFAEEVPVRYSEVVFKTAAGWQMRPWSRSPFGVKIQRDRQSTPKGEVLKAWAENVPAIPADPYGPPYADLAAQMMLLPTFRNLGPYQVPLLENWSTLSFWMARIYQDVRLRDAGVAQQARKTAGSGSPRQKAEALYRFVRDEVETQPEPGIFIDPDAALRKVLAARRGTPAEKALLLQDMLKAVHIGSSLVWAADRNRGAVDFEVVNPSWFDAVLVVVDFEGAHTFLDPSDRALAFGELRAGYEGTTAFIPGAGSLWQVRLPEKTFDQNIRQVTIELELDAAGRLAGRGILRLIGHPAYEKIGWQDSAARVVEAWQTWLAERYRDFQISDVTAQENPDAMRVVVTWTMAQREDEVLGDESYLLPSAPLGPATQPFRQPSSSRKTMVMFDYADRDEVELRLRWPAQWKVESLPAPATVENEVGALAAGVERKDGEPSLVYRRRFDIVRRVLRSPREYAKAQLLFAAAERSDAQRLVLVRR